MVKATVSVTFVLGLGLWLWMTVTSWIGVLQIHTFQFLLLTSPSTWFVNVGGCGRGKQNITVSYSFCFCKRFEVSQSIRSVMPFQECQTLGEFHAGFAWWVCTDYSTSCSLLWCERIVACRGVPVLWIARNWSLGFCAFQCDVWNISGYLYSSFILLWRLI